MMIDIITSQNFLFGTGSASAFWLGFYFIIRKRKKKVPITPISKLQEEISVGYAGLETAASSYRKLFEVFESLREGERV